MYEFSLYKAKPLSRKDIENIAIRLRKLFQIQDSLWVDVIHILENILPVFDEKFWLDIVPDRELDAHARAYPENHTIKIRESVYEGARNGVGRDRYTIMHEIFHFLWHGEEQIALARNPEKVERYENPEWQADVFAGAFLMPAHLIRGQSVEWVVGQCGVSKSAANYQLRIANNEKKTEYRTPSF